MESTKFQELQSKFFKLVQHNQLHQIKELLANIRQNYEEFETQNEKIVDSFVLKKSGDTALHICARLNYLELLKYLVDEECSNIEQTNQEGKTALHDAAQCSNLDVTNFLISSGANVNVVKKADWTPLMLACTKQEDSSLEVVQALIKSGADPFFVNKDGWNGIHVSAREGNLEIVKIILDSEPEMRKRLTQLRSRNGRKPLHTAVMHGHYQVTKLLIGEGTPEENQERDNCGTTPLMDASRFGFVPLIHLLLNYNLEEATVLLHQSNKQGQNCLHIACEAGQRQVVEELIKVYGMDVNMHAEDDRKMTPLHWAAKEGQTEVIKVLIQNGANFEAKDAIGRTPTDLAKALGRGHLTISL